MKEDPIDRLLDRTLGARAELRASNGCLGADELAAWTEGTLPARERAAAEEHAAGCDRCLAVLAAMAKTDPPPGPSPAPAWLSFRWLVPLTTMLVAVTAWIVNQGPPTALPPGAADAPAAVATGPEAGLRADSEQRAARENVVALERKAEETAASASAAPPAEPRMRQLADNAGATQQKPANVSEPAAKAAPPAAPEAAPVSSRLVASPDADVLWRITGRDVERTVNGGRSWQPQPTGSDVDLLAGAAPSASIAWIVGRKGMVLVSTDARTWRRLASPDPSADLIAVTADDASTAVVTTADGRRYRTTDAGRTWTLQETPAAPF